MIPYGKQSIDRTDIEAVEKILRSDFITQGPTITRFEQALARYCGTRYAVVLSSGTAALHAAYYAAGLFHGDEFITSPMTFAATANAGLYLGAKPVFVDICKDGNIDPREAEKKISKKTKFIVAVDYTGHPADINSLRRIARRHKILLIEDACHAFGAEYRGKRVGAISDMTVFSFHPVKSITTGEGGAVLTNRKDFYETMLHFRSHGITKDKSQFKNAAEGSWYHEMQELGFNYRLTDIQAALGLSQLKKLPKFLAARRTIAARYTRAFKRIPHLVLPGERSGVISAWHLYVIRLTGPLAKRRKEIFEALRGAGIGVQVHYIPVYWHPYYQKIGYKKGLCKNAEDFYAGIISLPIFPSLTLTEQNRVIGICKKILK